MLEKGALNGGHGEWDERKGGKDTACRDAMEEIENKRRPKRPYIDTAEGDIAQDAGLYALVSHVGNWKDYKMKLTEEYQSAK